MNHLDLFTGIGGFALAARWMGWKTVQFVEIDSYCQKVLKKNFPNTPIHGDIKTFNGEQYRGTIDILTGGFPCQPFSTAGKRKGTEDDRYLWPEKLRVIRAVQPTYIVGENVYGLVNWSKGMVFEQVQTSLEAEGYQVAPVILPACSVDAPHRRDRVWFVANSIGERGRRRNGQRENAIHVDTSSETINAGRDGCWRTTESAICGTVNGVSGRMDRLKGLGNAIVPQVALQIFKAIHETTRTTPFPG